MLIFTLPRRSQTGTCQINGQTASVRVLGKSLEYKAEGHTVWRRLTIAEVKRGPDSDMYVCK